MSAATQVPATAADGVSLRAMTARDLPAAHALSTQVRWPHRLIDWEFAFQFGDGVVAELDGALVGTAMCWRWGSRHATLGMVIVDTRYRGRRIGQQLMLGLLGSMEGRAVLLHATSEGRGLYERLGFNAIGEVRQHQGRAVQAPLVALEPGVRLRPASRNDAGHLIALDTVATGMERPALIGHLLDMQDVVILDREGHPVGFAALRRFGRGQVVGPVVAPDTNGAKSLISHWVNLHVGKFVRIDVDFSGGLMQWLETLGLRRAGGPITMVLGAAPQRGVDTRLYALVNQAMG